MRTGESDKKEPGKIGVDEDEHMYLESAIVKMTMEDLCAIEGQGGIPGRGHGNDKERDN